MQRVQAEGEGEGEQHQYQAGGEQGYHSEPGADAEAFCVGLQLQLGKVELVPDQLRDVSGRHGHEIADGLISHAASRAPERGIGHGVPPSLHAVNSKSCLYPMATGAGIRYLVIALRRWHSKVMVFARFGVQLAAPGAAARVDRDSWQPGRLAGARTEDRPARSIRDGNRRLGG